FAKFGTIESAKEIFVEIPVTLEIRPKGRIKAFGVSFDSILSSNYRFPANLLPDSTNNFQIDIPDELVEHYVAKSGFQCPDVRLIRLVAVATQKFIAEVATDALQHSKARQSAVVKDKKQQKDKRLTLTMDDLSKSLREVYQFNSIQTYVML
ncbi:hypothetical protein C5167_009819, partial [Papaver somniferum]